MGPDWWLLAGDGWLLILLPPFPPTSRAGRGWRGGGGGGGGGQTWEAEGDEELLCFDF